MAEWQAVGCEERALCLCEAVCRLLLLQASEPRWVAFLAGVPEFIVRVKAPPFPTLGWLPKSLCVLEGLLVLRHLMEMPVHPGALEWNLRGCTLLFESIKTPC